VRAHSNKIGITGGSGFIGSSLAKHLAKSFEVKLLDIKEPKQKFNETVSFQYCDIRDYGQVRKALEDVDLIIHAAVVQIPLITNDKRLGYDVDVLGTQNVCRAVDENSEVKGVILASSWHVMGDRNLWGIVDESFGFRPDMVEDRTKLYVLAKIAQGVIVRFYDEMSEKIFGVVRMGTVLGEGMPEETAANIFIENGLAGKLITPFKQSMFRPMLYVDINDVCEGYENFARRILNNETDKGKGSIAHVINLFYPVPITILELAEIVRDTVVKYSNGKIKPEIEIMDTGQPILYKKSSSQKLKVDITKAQSFLKIKKLKSPKESIEEIIEERISKTSGGIESPT
jgi:UDP-glucose 4-epimerase